MIYAQSGYVYTILPYLLRLGGAKTLGASHATNGIVGALSHPYTHPPMGYGFPQGGADSSSTFPRLRTTYLGYDMHPHFSQPIYQNVTVIRIHNLMLHLLQH